MGVIINGQELLLHYNFDNNVEDLSGNNYNGTASGVTFVADRNGNPNSAVRFDGVNDFIDLPNLADLKPELPVSVSFWIKYESDNVTDRVVFNTSFMENVNSGIFLTTQSSTGKLAVGYGDGSSSFTSNNRRSYLSNNIIKSNAWHQIHIVVLSATNMKVYLDCVETGGVYSGSGTSFEYSSGAGSLGRHDQNGSNISSYYFKGVLDDFKYYKGEIVPDVKTTSFSNLKSLICRGENYTLPTISSNNISGNWTPSISNTNIGSATYTFIPNEGQCATRYTHQLEVTSEIKPNFNGLETELCEGSIYNLPTTSSNGITGDWSPVFDNTKVGNTTYTFTPNTGGCTSVFSHTIEIKNKVTPSFIDLETELCEGSLYSLPTTSSNGITGDWSPVFDNTKVGNTTYTFTPNTGGCTSVFSHTIEIKNKVTPSFIDLETELCEESLYNLPTTSSNGITGDWSPILDNTKIGNTTYTFTPNSGECASVFSHTIEIKNKVTPIFIDLETELCAGSVFSFPTISSNGITGTWSPILDNAKIGNTTYTFTPNTGECASIFNHSIEIKNKVTPIFIDLETELCEGSLYNLPTTSSNGIAGTWSPVFDNTKIGITAYTFTPDSEECIDIVNYSIEIKSKLVPDFSNLKTLLCAGSVFILPTISSNGIEGTWLPAFDNATIGKTTYTFTPNSVNCVSSISHILEITDEIIPSFVNLESELCEGSTYELPKISIEGVSGTWFPAIDNTQIGTTVYTFTPNSSDCAISVNHSLEIKKKESLTFTNLESELCEGNTYNLPTTSTNGYVGVWTPVFDNTKLGSTNYTFTPNSEECAKSFNHTIEIKQKEVTIFNGSENSLCEGSSYVLPTISSNGILGTWSPVFDSTKIGTTVYTFLPTSEECATGFSHSIEIKNKITPTFTGLITELCEESVYSLPKTSSNGIKGTWLPIFDNSKIGNTIYTFVPDSDECASNLNHSIEIKEKVTPSFINLETSLCEESSYNLPTVSSNGIRGVWTPVINSSNLGVTVYTFTPENNECATSFVHSIEFTEKIVPSFTNLENSLCEGDLYTLPTNSSNGIEGNWSPTFDNTQIGNRNYTFTPNTNECATSYTHTIEINEKVSPLFSNLESVIFIDENYKLPNISDNGIKGFWSPIFDNSKLGEATYTFSAINVDCKNDYVHRIFISKPLTIPAYFAQNNHNIND